MPCNPNKKPGPSTHNPRKNQASHVLRQLAIKRMGIEENLAQKAKESRFPNLEFKT